MAFESALHYFLTFGDGASECIAAGSLPSGDNPPYQPRCLDSLTSHESLVAILLHQLASFNIMSETLPLTVTTPLQFENGIATGFSHRWKGGQYCTILTEVGIVGCGIYDVKTAGEFGQAIAIAKGTVVALQRAPVFLRATVLGERWRDLKLSLGSANLSNR